MSYTVVISRSAEKELKSLDVDIALRIGNKLIQLRNEPYPPQCKHLHPSKFCRLKIGSYRVVYSVNTTRKIITILGIGHRREIYRKLKSFK